MRLIDDYPVEVLISLALVTGTYAVAQRLHVSGPLAMVAAGLLIGDRGPRYAMSNRTQTYLFGLWTVIDEVLNSVLFLLIGLEVLVLSLERASLTLALAAIPIVLVARLLAVAAPLPLFIRSGISVLTQRPLPDLGRRPRRHLGGSCPVAAGERGPLWRPGGDLRRRAVQHCRAGPDAWVGGKADDNVPRVILVGLIRSSHVFR